MNTILTFIIFLVLSLFSSAGLSAQQKVIFGAYINDIYALDLKSGSAEVDIDIWTISDSSEDWIQRLEIKNGLIEEKSAEVKKV
jgi:hypothetical protein